MIILFKKAFFCVSQSDFDFQKNIHMNENTKTQFEAKLTTLKINNIESESNNIQVSMTRMNMFESDNI